MIKTPKAKIRNRNVLGHMWLNDLEPCPRYELKSGAIRLVSVETY